MPCKSTLWKGQGAIKEKQLMFLKSHKNKYKKENCSGSEDQIVSESCANLQPHICFLLHLCLRQTTICDRQTFRLGSLEYDIPFYQLPRPW